MYEITFIAKNEENSSVKKTIGNLNGKIISESSLGRKRFAYPIKKEDSGYYTTYIFEIDPDKMIELNKELQLKEDVLRYLILGKKIIKEIPKVENVKDTEFEKNKKVELEIKNIEKEEKVSDEKITAKSKKIDKIKKEETPLKKADEVAKQEIKKPEVKVVAPEKQMPDEEERLKKLEEKLNELLKD